MRKKIFKLLCVIALIMGAVVYAHDKDVASETIGAVLAVAPIAAVAVGKFNVDNLKIPQAEFDKLKAKYGRLYVIDINIDEDESYQFIVIRPTRQLLSALAKYKDDIDKANDMIIKNMVVGGDMEGLDDGIVYASLMKDIARIIDQGKSFLSKA